MANYTVTLGPKAQVFHDATTGITICKGEKVSLRGNQYNSPKIRAAISTGHLMIISTEAKPAVNSQEDLEKLEKKILAQYKKGVEISKIAQGITLDQAKKLAEKNSVEVEETDTAETILGAILEE